jgi:hypothetical protein
MHQHITRVANVSIWRKIGLYRQYSKVISSSRAALGQMNFRVDMVDRLYTVVNVPEELFEGIYDARKSDAMRISQGYMAEYLRNISRTFNEMGLSELYRVYDTRMVDKHSFLVVIGFSLFDTGKVAVRAVAMSVAAASIGLLAYIYQLIA